MGSYKWGYKSPNMGYKYSYPTSNPILITTHEPPNTESHAPVRRALMSRRYLGKILLATCEGKERGQQPQCGPGLWF